MKEITADEVYMEIRKALKPELFLNILQVQEN
jgi:hypothetical protein